MGRVKDKVVLVTGAGGGQGREEALALASEGASVIATDLEAPIFDDPGTGIICRPLDVGDEGSWAETVDFVGGQFGRLDGLVDNAGITLRTRLGEIAKSDVERVLLVNLVGPLLGIQAVEPLMARGGSIVNVSSIAALGGHFPVAYTISKWGLRGLSRVASMELGGRGIRVNTVLPGFIESPMTEQASPAFRTANVDDTPLGRVGTVEDVAPLVVYLISDESSFVSGAEIVVDGGQTAHGGSKAKIDAIEREVEERK